MGARRLGGVVADGFAVPEPCGPRWGHIDEDRSLSIHARSSKPDDEVPPEVAIIQIGDSSRTEGDDLFAMPQGELVHTHSMPEPHDPLAALSLLAGPERYRARSRCRSRAVRPPWDGREVAVDGPRILRRSSGLDNLSCGPCVLWVGRPVG